VNNSIRKTIALALLVLLGFTLISCNREIEPTEPIDPIAQWHDDPDNRYWIIENVEQTLEIWNLSRDDIIEVFGEPLGKTEFNHEGDYYAYMTYLISDDYGTRKEPKDRLYYIVFTEDGQVKRTFTVPDESAATDLPRGSLSANYDLEGDFR
jgi:hypothetical protein